MKTPTLLITALTVAAVGVTAPAAPAATGTPNHAGGSCSPWVCGSTGNHNEILTTTTGA